MFKNLKTLEDSFNKNISEKTIFINVINMDEFFRKTISEGTAFIVDESIDYKKWFETRDRKQLQKITALDSIFSYKFGITKDDDDSILMNIYTCACGNLKGTQNLHRVCPDCGKPVARFVPKRLGWFVSKNVKLIHPYIAYLMHKHCANKLHDVMLGKNKLFTPEDIYINGRLHEFLLKYLPATLKEHANIYKDILYTNYIPIHNKKFREMKLDSNLGVLDIRQHDINKSLFNLSPMINDLNTEKDMLNIKKIAKLHSISEDLYNIYCCVRDEIFINKKQYMRAEKYGTRAANTARLIIAPIVDPSITDISDCQLPIDVYRVIFAHAIEKELKKMKYNINDIPRMIDANSKLTKEEKEVIVKIFHKIPNNYIYINREPSIYMTSVLSVRIHSLIDEMVLRISSFILLGIAGDYDGDTVGIMAWTKDIHRKYVNDSFNIQNYMIDTLDIKFTGAAAPHNTFGVSMYMGFKNGSKLKKIKEK